MVPSLIAALAAAAQPVSAGEPAPGPVAALEACRAVAAATDRLACFDRAAAAFAAARARKDVVVMDRAEVNKTKRGLFGFSLPSLRLFGGDDDQAVREIEGKLTGAAPYGYGYYVLTFDDGSQWQTTDRAAGFSPKRGDTVKIKAGAFGYRLYWKFLQLSVKRSK